MPPLASYSGSRRLRTAALPHGQFAGTLLFVRTKRLMVVAAAALLAIVIIYHFIMVVFEVRIEPSRPTRFVNMLELAPFAFSVVCLIAIAPRFNEWERLGGKVYRQHVFVASVGALVLPQLLALACLPALPPDMNPSQWTWIISNLLFWSSLGLLLASSIGHYMASALLVCAFSATVAGQNIAGPVLSWLPVASGWDSDPRLEASIGLAAISLFAYSVRFSTRSIEFSFRRNE